MEAAYQDKFGYLEPLAKLSEHWLDSASTYSSERLFILSKGFTVNIPARTEASSSLFSSFTNCSSGSSGENVGTRDRIIEKLAPCLRWWQIQKLHELPHFEVNSMHTPKLEFLTFLKSYRYQRIGCNILVKKILLTSFSSTSSFSSSSRFSFALTDWVSTSEWRVV